jgi:hypothetical protein
MTDMPLSEPLRIPGAPAPRWAALAVGVVCAVIAPVCAAQSAQPLSAAARQAHAHVLRSADNARAPFVIIDKRSAHLWLFDAKGRATGDTPILLGFARGDHTVPGIGERPIAQVMPHERTTPAGRFVAERGRNARGEMVLWVDYDAAVSMHREIAGQPHERRAERMASKTPKDNRISYGCINIPARFFDSTLLPLSQQQVPVVYVLPETRAWSTIFETPQPVAQRGPG